MMMIMMMMVFVVDSSSLSNKHQQQEETIYTAVFLDDASRAAVLETFPKSLLDRVYAEHMTIKFRPTTTENLPIGKIVPLYAILWASDGNTCQGMQVRSPEIDSTNEYPHVTISTSNDTGAVCTNDLLTKLHNGTTKNIESDTIDPNLVLYGCVDTYPRSGMCNQSTSRFPPEKIIKETSLDWFDFSNNQTFQQRIFTYSGFWNQNSGPIIFFFGGEGYVEDFYENSGFLFEIAARVSGLIVFLEHRYYGETMPFGKESYRNEELKYLTIEQALADAADVMYRKSELFGCSASTKIIMFGGSYGGMLAAWHRLSYPHLSNGAIVSGAPVDLYPGERKDKKFWNATMYTYETYGSLDCRVWIDKAMSRMTMSNLKLLNNEFQTCQKIESFSDLERLVSYVKGSLSTMAMVDYPYALNFVAPLPANPVRYVCDSVQPRTDDAALLKALRFAINTFVNFTGAVKCFDTEKEMLSTTTTTTTTTTTLISQEKNDDPPLGDITRPWNYQACSELILEPLSAEGLGFVVPEERQISSVESACSKWFGSKFNSRPDWLLEKYGNGIEMSKNLRNILFVDGDKDPWRVGSIPQNASLYSPSVSHVLAIDSAHHQDLRYSSPSDSKSLWNVKLMEQKEILKWLS